MTSTHEAFISQRPKAKPIYASGRPRLRESPVVLVDLVLDEGNQSFSESVELRLDDLCPLFEFGNLFVNLN